MENEFISKIHSYSETQIRDILRMFLPHSGTYGSDKFRFEYINKYFDKNELIDKVTSIEYYRKVIVGAKYEQYDVWEGIRWILDLLPNSPKLALNVINAYFYANCQFLPDNPLSALSECSTIIRARYINYEREEDIFYEMNPLDFEKLVALLYEEMGYTVEMTKKSYDNGIDIYASKFEMSQKEKIIIQCKRYTTSKIGVNEIRCLLGVVSNEKATKGVLVTSSTFTKEAYKLMDKNPRIELIDYKNLI